MSTELDDILNPPADPPPSQPPEETLEQKVGRLVNADAENRRTIDGLRAQVEALGKPKDPPPISQDDDWEKWGAQRVKEAGSETDWMTNPSESARKLIVSAGKDLVSNVEARTRQYVDHAVGGVRLDIEFDQLYPDLSTRGHMGKQAQREAVAELRSNPKFLQAITNPNPAIRQRAYSAVEKRAREILGIVDEPGRRDDGSLDNIPPQRKGVFAQPGGGRIGNVGPRVVEPEREKEVIGQMIDHMQGRPTSGN